jgi:hypothetical protein
LLAGAAGAVAVSAAAAFVGSLEVDAATDQVTYTNDQTSADVFTARSVVQAGFSPSGQGNAVTGRSDSGIGVFGASNSWFGMQAQSVSYPGLFGTSESDYGVLGQGGTDGVHGQGSPHGNGVSGESDSGAGVLGTAGSGTGVYGYANLGIKAVGVSGKSPTGRGGQFSGGKAQLRLVPSTATTHPSRGSLGDLFLDKNKRLWFCKGGTTWHQIA